MDALNTIFGQMKDLTTGQECGRAVLIFAYGFAMVRVLGRRVFGKWAALDIIISIIVGSNLSRALTGSAPLWGPFWRHRSSLACIGSWPRLQRDHRGCPITLRVARLSWRSRAGPILPSCAAGASAKLTLMKRSGPMAYRIWQRPSA